MKVQGNYNRNLRNVAQGIVLPKQQSFGAAYIPRNYTKIRELSDAIYENSSGARKRLMDMYVKSGENLNNMVTALGTAFVAPIFIAFNPASKEDKEESNSKSYKDASNTLSAYERALTMVTRAGIQAIRSEVSSARQVIGKLVAYGPSKESAVLEEMAWLEGADDFATSEDIPAEEINADDVKSDPDVEINVTVDDDGNECSK